MTRRDFWTRALALAGALDTTSYFVLLGVGPGASPDEVRAAYSQRIGEYHPDRHSGERDPERRRALVSIQARLNEAYRVLTNPTRRAAYQRALAEGQTRLVGRTAPVARSEGPRTPRARLYYELGEEREKAGDLAGARTQYRLAIQVEPECAAIAEAIARIAGPNVTPTPPPAAPPAPAPPTSDFAREDTRHPFARPVRLQCRSWDHLITLHARNLSRGGIFVKTASPLELGTHVEVQLTLPDGRGLSLDAEVARVVAPERDDDREPSGMALRFLEMDAERRRLFDDALREAAAHVEPPPPLPAATRPVRALSPDPIEEVVLRDVLADVARMREARRHDVLGVRPDASRAELRAAYARLVQRHHPDHFVRHRSALVLDAAIDAFALVRQAYEQMLAAPAPRAAAGTPVRPLGEDHARAAEHLQRAYAAKAAGRQAEAIEHFMAVLQLDKSCEEAIRELRQARRS